MIFALTIDPLFIWGVIQAAIGLGILIFVHELGHFAVAKMCGVKCEKFMIGFDIGGYKISRKWGETVYGIGILPLGGYVKMLGQDDDPSHIAEQLEKSQVQDDGVEVTAPDGKKYMVDRRSYMAKSVPQRMAIISAGVVMNVIFAFIFAFIAYGIGVPYVPCVVSQTVAGSPAWEANLRTGDAIVEIDDVKNPSFSQLMGKVSLGDLETGVPLELRRASDGSVEDLTLKPRRQAGKGLVKIGVAPPSSLRLLEKHAVMEGSAAAKAEPAFEGDDDIISVNGKPVTTYAEFVAASIRHRSEPLEITVRRGGDKDRDSNASPSISGEEVTITVPPQPVNRLGLIMELGELSAVQPESPAAEAGIKAGAKIKSIGTTDDATAIDFDAEDFDPVMLPNRVQQLAAGGQSLTVTLEGGEQIAVEPRQADWLVTSGSAGAPITTPELGLAFQVTNTVRAVKPNSAADEAGLQAGDKMILATLEFPIPGSTKTDDMPIGLGETLSWPMVFDSLQNMPTGGKAKVEFRRNGEERTVELTPQRSTGDFFDVDRGIRLASLRQIRRAASISEQAQLGWDKTVESLLMVYRFIQKLFEKQVPVTALGGPGEIAKQAFLSASAGPGLFLMFLTLLSANLAVVNFLPIPVLDGGHMVFLAYEGIVGRPANERFVVAMHLAGFAFILLLMSFLIALDVGLIPRNL